MLASISGMKDTVTLLVDRGADMEATDKVRISQHSTIYSVHSFLTTSTLCRMVGRPC
jgi:hypothetical protein